jgi:hypothetical protein
MAAQAITDEVDKDTTQQNGPNYVKSKLKDKLIMVPRSVLRNIVQYSILIDYLQTHCLQHYA